MSSYNVTGLLSIRCFVTSRTGRVTVRAAEGVSRVWPSGLSLETAGQQEQTNVVGTGEWDCAA
jgi:hypothetical protein